MLNPIEAIEHMGGMSAYLNTVKLVTDAMHLKQGVVGLNQRASSKPDLRVPKGASAGSASARL